MSNFFSTASLRLVQVGSSLAVIGAIHSWFNLKALRDPESAVEVTESVSVLLPVLNEAERVAPTIQSILNQRELPNLEFIVRDDGSTDQTVSLITHLTKGAKFPITIIIDDEPAPSGWVSKSWSCHRMSQIAKGSVLVFIDADVQFEPTAISQAIATMRKHDLDLVSPYPKQTAITWSERLIQPLLQWSWLTLLPLRIAERSTNPALVAANGQFLVVDADKYRSALGHAANPAAVLDDIALLQAIKRNGGKGGVIDGTKLATTRMYRNVTELTDGYTKSLWSAAPNRNISRALSALLILAYLIPPIAALSRINSRISRAGAVGYLAAIASRFIIGKRTDGRDFPDSVTHPISILGYISLTELSWQRKLRNKLHWRGKKLP